MLFFQFLRKSFAQFLPESLLFQVIILEVVGSGFPQRISTESKEFAEKER